MISIDNYDFKGKRAIIRVDFNVPVDAEGNVTDDTRIRAAMPTIKKVLAEGGAVILMSHMGRPKKNPDMKYTLEQIVPAVEKNLGVKVQFAGDCMGEKAAEMCKNMQPGEVVMLENLRFYAEEEGKPRGLAEDATKEEKDAAKKGEVPMMTTFSVYNLKRNNKFDYSKAERELGYTTRPLEETLRDEAQWLLENGKIKVSVKKQ